jgi:pyrophosphatase PpaX
MKHDLILYDLDGTIWDSVPVIMMTFKYAYEQVLGKCERTDEDLMSYIGKPLETTFSMHDEKTARALLEAYLEYNHKLLAEDAVPLFPGVYDDLKMLKETGVMQGVVTSKRKDSAMLTLELKGLESFF